MAGKHGKLNISTTQNKYFFTDTALLIRDSHQYPNEAGLRSIVIHAANGGGARIACATIGRQLVASFDGTGDVRSLSVSSVMMFTVACRRAIPPDSLNSSKTNAMATPMYVVLITMLLDDSLVTCCCSPDVHL